MFACWKRATIVVTLTAVRSWIREGDFLQQIRHTPTVGEGRRGQIVQEGALSSILRSVNRPSHRKSSGDTRSLRCSARRFIM
jgi:hypothetical protein